MVSPDAVGDLFASGSPALTLRKLAERVCNAAMQARKTEAKIMEMMPSKGVAILHGDCAADWHPDDRKTRSRFDRLVSDRKIERTREQGTHGPVYLFRRFS
jgi:hypothetical protein